MATLVFFHAHPDDESIATAATMARAAAEGHRVVLVLATRGEHGEPVPGVLAEGEQLGVRRSSEVYASADALGTQRVEFLGYADSGMMGEATNDVPWSFWQADIDQAAHRLAAILDEERPDVLTIYDDNGAYGHPDHIQVHRVGRRAGQLAGVPVIVQSTINRDALRRGMTERLAQEEAVPDGMKPSDFDELGKPEELITHFVDGSAHLAEKRKSMLSHPSQMSEEHFLLAMPDEVFAGSMGTEWYILDDASSAQDVGPLADLFQKMR